MSSWNQVFIARDIPVTTPSLNVWPGGAYCSSFEWFGKWAFCFLRYLQSSPRIDTCGMMTAWWSYSCAKENSCMPPKTRKFPCLDRNLVAKTCCPEVITWKLLQWVERRRRSILISRTIFIVCNYTFPRKKNSAENRDQNNRIFFMNIEKTYWLNIFLIYFKPK